jgi:hypothetical protein
VRGATLATLILLEASRAGAADFDELLRRAAEARGAGNSEETLSLLEQAYQLRPLPEVLNNIGRTLEELGRYDEAAAAYRRVVDDSSAKAALIDLDRQRLASLEKKLGRGWLLVKDAGVRAFLDGDPVLAGQEIEVPLGPHLLELSEGASARLIFFTALPSHRTEVTQGPAERLENDASLDLRQARVERLFVNDRPIGSSLPGLTIALPAGTYRIRAETAAGVQSKQIRIGEGRRLLLSSILEAPKPEAITAAVTTSPERSIAGPLVLGVSGAIALGVGAALVGIAEQDRSRVRNAGREDGVVVGLTMIEAVRLEARADDRATAGIIAFSSAGVLGIGAVLWWLLDL